MAYIQLSSSRSDESPGTKKRLWGMRDKDVGGQFPAHSPKYSSSPSQSNLDFSLVSYFVLPVKEGICSVALDGLSLGATEKSEIVSNKYMRYYFVCAEMRRVTKMFPS